MATTIVHTQVTVSQQSSGAYAVKVAPPVTRVPNNNSETSARLVWGISGGTLVGFNWKDGSGQPTVTVTSTGLESAEYTKNTGDKSVNWEYEFTVEIDGGPTLIIDPEVENLPPGQP